MLVYPYSLVRQQPVDIAEVQSVLSDPFISREDYYKRCIDLFPVVMGEMTAAEIQGQQNLKGFKHDKAPAAIA